MTSGNPAGGTPDWSRDPRIRAAALAGVPLRYAKLIHGETERELVADAAQLRLEMMQRGLRVVEPLAAFIAREASS